MKTKLFCGHAVPTAIVALAAIAALAAPVAAMDITKEWTQVKPPPVPELKPVTVDPKTTALLVLDLMKGNCGVRPRCASPPCPSQEARSRRHAPTT